MAATINRSLAALRRALKLAAEWKIIARAPKVTMLPGERTRDFVLDDATEKAYLEATPERLKSAAVLLLETGLRVGEALALEWGDVSLDPSPGKKFGLLKIRRGKTKNAKRSVSLSKRATELLRARSENRIDQWVFSNGYGKPYANSHLDRMHVVIRQALGLPDDFVLHSLRHTFLTRLGESGADAFTIMRIAGHSTIAVSQRYVHPSDESMERAFEGLG